DGIVPAISMERCPRSHGTPPAIGWNSARHQRGIVPVIGWNTHLGLPSGHPDEGGGITDVYLHNPGPGTAMAILPEGGRFAVYLEGAWEVLHAPAKDQAVQQSAAATARRFVPRPDWLGV
ncbi:MAG: hypothetical protein AB7E83_26905, partial [Ramlibacter sp.]